jgi:hypothetical protein
LGSKLPASIACPSTSEAQNNLSIKTLSSNPASTRARVRNCPKTQTKIKARRHRKTTWHRSQVITSRHAQAAKGSAFTMILEKSAAQPPKPLRRRDLSKSTITTHQVETQSAHHQLTAKDGSKGRSQPLRTFIIMHSILQKQRSNWIFLAMERGFLPLWGNQKGLEKDLGYLV